MKEFVLLYGTYRVGAWRRRLPVFVGISLRHGLTLSLGGFGRGMYVGVAPW